MPTPNNPTKSKDASIPMYDGSYYMIVTRVVESLKRERGLANKLRGATREAKAMAGHTRVRFHALSPRRRMGVGALLVGLGVALTAAVFALALRSDPDALRSQIRAHLSAGNLMEARRDLETLRSSTGELSKTDRRELAAPLNARLESTAAGLRARIDAKRRGKKFPEALAEIEQLEALDVDAPWVEFNRAEIYRAAQRHDEAVSAYARFTKLYPDSDRVDDALYWQAEALNSRGAPAEAKAMLEEIIAKYPRSNFSVSAKRLLAEINGEPPPDTRTRSPPKKPRKK